MSDSWAGSPKECALDSGQHLGLPGSEHPEVPVRVPGEQECSGMGRCSQPSLRPCAARHRRTPPGRGGSPGRAAALKGASSGTLPYLCSLRSAGAGSAQSSSEAGVREVNMFTVKPWLGRFGERGFS